MIFKPYLLFPFLYSYFEIANGSLSGLCVSFPVAFQKKIIILKNILFFCLQSNSIVAPLQFIGI